MNYSLCKKLLFVITALFLISVSFFSYADSSINPAVSSVHAQLMTLEASSGGRLGIAAINTGNNTQLQYRGAERFPLCSTAKVMAVSAILKKNMTQPDLLQQKIIYSKANLIPWSPITEKNLTSGMTIAELGKAAIEHTDNTAMNLLLQQLGGPQAVTAFARSIQDKTFRLDRAEPALNTAIPGDVRDTTTPAAMANSLRKLALGNILGLSERKALQTWLKDNTTGDARIRAGAPKGSIVGDKTGTGVYGTTNDVGIIWLPKHPPIVIAIYFTQTKPDALPNNHIIAEATRIVTNALMQK